MATAKRQGYSFPLRIVSPIQKAITWYEVGDVKGRKGKGEKNLPLSYHPKVSAQGIPNGSEQRECVRELQNIEKKKKVNG